MSAGKTEIDLSKYEKKIYSQNGEDGVIEKIFEMIGTTSKNYVEFGVEGGWECNTRYIRESCGWYGLLMDMGYENHTINLQKEVITAENINSLFTKYQVPQEFDMLSIDIDFNDFYIWIEISKHYRPRVVVIEYNATHLPNIDKVAVYHPYSYWDGSNYFGASILALYRLGNKTEYSLIYAEDRGINLFFIRDDVLDRCPIQFKDTNCVDLIYKYPKYGSGPNGGHNADPFNRSYLSADFLLKY